MQHTCPVHGPGVLAGDPGSVAPLRFAEHEELKKLLPEMLRFEPTWEELELYRDGGVAIIDQWICSHARCLHRPARPVP